MLLRKQVTVTLPLQCQTTEFPELGWSRRRNLFFQVLLLLINRHGRKCYSGVVIRNVYSCIHRQWKTKQKLKDESEQIVITNHNFCTSLERNKVSYQSCWFVQFFFPTWVLSCLSVHFLILCYFPESCALLDDSTRRITITYKKATNITSIKESLCVSANY